MLTLSSTSENPRPARTRRLYLMDGQRTIGLSLSTGRGARAAALERRALRRRDLRPGYVFNISMPPQYLSRLRACGCRWRWVEVGGALVPGRSGCGHDAANPCGNLWDISMFSIVLGSQRVGIRLCCIC